MNLLRGLTINPLDRLIKLSQPLRYFAIGDTYVVRYAPADRKR